MPKKERGKLDSEAKKWILRGYREDMKGYRLYDLMWRMICFSRDVSFNEKDCGIEREIRGSEGYQYLELDILNHDDGNAEPVPVE